MSFTPGPWDMKWRTFHDVPYFESVVDSNGERIRVDGVTLTGGDEAQANARLIAAAPELLEALRELLSTTDAEHKLAMLDKGIGTATSDAMWLRARAAIAKATGSDK